MDEGGVRYYAALYGLVSCLLVMLVVLLLYVACSRRYKLNWFEKNLLEAATELSRESLLVRSPQPGTTPTIAEHEGDEKGDFWVPPNLQRQGSVDHTSGEESVPGPSTPMVEEPVSSLVEPVARSEKLVVLSSVPRPHVSSMQTRLDHTKIKPSLYQAEHIKDAGDEEEDLRGAVHLSLAYDPAAGILTVRLLEAHDLQARDFSGTADPYAKIRLLPDKSNVWQTRIHKRTLNPVFDEDFVFEVRPNGLGRRVLEVILYDFDAYSRHHSIGGVKLPMSQIDLCQKVTIWKALGPCSEQDSKAELGDLMVSMAYLPSAERLTVVIMKARNLRVVDDTRLSSDPFVKVALIQAGKRVKKKKTGVHRNTLSPIFNEALTFDIGRDALAKTTIEFLVMHDSLLGPSELLGRVVVGPGADARPHERDLHHQLLTFNKPSASITEWLPLSDPQ